MAGQACGDEDDRGLLADGAVGYDRIARFDAGLGKDRMEIGDRKQLAVRTRELAW